MRRLTLFTALALVAGVLVGQPPDLIESPIQSPIQKAVYPPVSPFTGAAFSPSDVSGLLVWAEADGTMTESGGSVSSWGEPGYTALTQGTGAKQPTYTADDGDGLPAVTFDGSDDVLISVSNVSIDAGGTFALYLVARGATTSRMLVEFSPIVGTNSGFFLYQTSARVDIPGGGTGQETGGSPDVSVADTWADYEMVYPAVATSSLVVTENGTQLWDSYVSNDAVDIGGVSDDLHLGGRGPTPSLPWNGAFREVLFFTPAPTASERAQILAYLRAKWGTGP